MDASDGERLERWGDYILIRPDPQIIWHTPKNNPNWKNSYAHYIRSKSGGGNWEKYKKIPEVWNVSYDSFKFNIKMMNFKHTGVFPEQAINWKWLEDNIKNEKSEISILNLFAYTGGATLACAKAGARVCHVDSSKGMVAWARENAKISGLENAPIRWIVDDCEKFLRREISRGKKYEGIIMDPPSYGRGTKGEIWKLEENIFEFLKLCTEVLSKNALFFMLNSYSTGLSASVMGYMLKYILFL